MHLKKALGEGSVGLRGTVLQAARALAPEQNLCGQAAAGRMASGSVASPFP
ncbi:hypothetical protein J31TS4_32000 [Paenibacillus sp. J31TS4]|nr:hypothetical protein J31TS4_32000 [Paenibacillus sp. J31TS4]